MITVHLKLTGPLEKQVLAASKKQHREHTEYIRELIRRDMVGE